MNEQLRPTIPHDAPRKLANLIRSCWKDAAAERPSFFRIVHRLKRMLTELEEDEAQKRRLRVEYERELIAGGSGGGGGGGGILQSTSALGRSLLKHNRSNATPNSSGGTTHEGEELVLQVNPLLRLRKSGLVPDDSLLSPRGSSSTSEAASHQKPTGHRRKFSIGGESKDKEKDSIARS